MIVLFENATLLAGDGTLLNNAYVEVTDKFISFVGGKPEYKGKPDRRINCQGKLLMPAFYNTHCHAAMTLFRGYGEDLPLQRWLEEKIYPAEDRLTDERVKLGSELAAAEMIRNGIVSFSDMYMFVDSTARVVADTGMKANLSRNVVSFDDSNPADSYRVQESLKLFNEFNGICDGRIIIDMSLHAVYSNTEKMCRYMAELTAELKARIQIHVSETKQEVDDCIARYGATPFGFLNSCGLFDVPATAAHCVWATDSDIDIIKEKNIYVAHNPVSNLKLGSGVMPYNKMMDKGVSVCLGTDGTASNNKLDMIRELQTAALIHKGVNCDPIATKASDMIVHASRNGALSQGRDDCGYVRAGFRADLILADLETINNIPSYEPDYSLVFSMNSADIVLTMCDGSILYENGAYNTIDEEKLRFDAKRIISRYFID